MDLFASNMDIDAPNVDFSMFHYHKDEMMCSAADGNSYTIAQSLSKSMFHSKTSPQTDQHRRPPALVEERKRCSYVQEKL